MRSVLMRSASEPVARFGAEGIGIEVKLAQKGGAGSVALFGHVGQHELPAMVVLCETLACQGFVALAAWNNVSLLGLLDKPNASS